MQELTTFLPPLYSLSISFRSSCIIPICGLEDRLLLDTNVTWQGVDLCVLWNAASTVQRWGLFPRLNYKPHFLLLFIVCRYFEILKKQRLRLLSRNIIWHFLLVVILFYSRLLLQSSRSLMHLTCPVNTADIISWLHVGVKEQNVGSVMFLDKGMKR